MTQLLIFSSLGVQAERTDSGQEKVKRGQREKKEMRKMYSYSPPSEMEVYKTRKGLQTTKWYVHMYIIKPYIIII